VEALERGQVIHQETRLFDPAENKTFPMRSKEEAHDYRYFPEPDLPPLILEREMVEAAKRSLPELPHEKIERLMDAYNLPLYDAKILASSRLLADYFEQAAKVCHSPKSVSHWILREVLRVLKERDESITQFPVSPQLLAELVNLVESKKVTMAAAKEIVFPEMLRQPRSPEAIVEEKGLSRVFEETELEAIIDRVLEKNPGPVNQYKQGKTQVLGFFVGQVRRETRGLADPQLIEALLRAKLNKPPGHD